MGEFDGQKPSVKITWIIIIIAAAVIIGAGSLYFLEPDKGRSSIGIGSAAISNPDAEQNNGWQGDTIYIGNIKWRVLSADDKEILLLADHIPERYKEVWTDTAYQKDEKKGDWWNSSLWSYLNEDLYSEAFTGIERAAMLGNENEELVVNCLFLLGEKDARLARYGLKAANDTAREYDAAWWLMDGGIVDASGNIQSGTGTQADRCAVRPACLLDASTLIFAADAAFDRGTAIAEELKEVPTGEAAGEWIAVLSSAQQYLTVDSAVREENVCTVTYSGAAIGENNYISAIVTNGEEDKVYAYGKIADTSSQDSGKARIILPDNMPENYRLKIFSEQDRGEYQTDYASVPITVIISGSPVLDGPIVSIGRLEDKAAAIVDKDIIIGSDYDKYLDWTADDFENAAEEDKLMAAAAALLYEAKLEQLRDSLSAKDIEGAVNYVKENPDMALGLAEGLFERAEHHSVTLKEVIELIYR